MTLNKFLDYASYQYYHGRPILTDEQFDALTEKYRYDAVGHSITDGVPHMYPMFSLQKFFDLDEVPFSNSKTMTSPKLDGAAVSLLYGGGELQQALTRGDGKMGRDITQKMKLLVPNFIGRGGLVQITGEVVAPSAVENSRNYASGSLNLKSLDEFKKRELYFYAYEVTPNQEELWSQEMVAAKEWGFHTVRDNVDKFPTDGLVMREDSYKCFFDMGFTSHHPRGAYALKEKKAGSITKLLDVIWQVGKSGVVSPVAILEPVKIGDALVSKATLHNIQYIEELGLEIGCSVEVIRSGEIIPRIVRRIG
jgi:DNA ligase (NAD+)